MRLGQLSRKLEVSSDQIAKLLNDNFREVSSHPNVKLTDEELDFVQNHFPPPVKAKTPEPAEPAPVLEAPTVEESPSEVDEVEAEKEKEEVEKETPEFVESLRPQFISLEEEFLAQTDGLELYKTEKPVLEGLKVVGKIELPEPVIKEKTEDDLVKEARKTRERKSNRRDDVRRRSGSNGPSLIEARKKAERLERKKKIEEEKKLRELKKKHYEENVKAKIVKTPPKKKKKPAQAVVAHIAPTTSTVSKKRPLKKAAPKSTNPLKKFWLWLNGEYDK